MSEPADPGSNKQSQHTFPVQNTSGDSSRLSDTTFESNSREEGPPYSIGVTGKD